MPKPGGGFVHVAALVQGAVSFADENAFVALVAVRGDRRDETAAGGDFLLDDRPLLIAGLEVPFVKPDIQPRATEA
jgi:hypothetical protein